MELLELHQLLDIFDNDDFDKFRLSDDLEYIEINFKDIRSPKEKSNGGLEQPLKKSYASVTLDVTFKSCIFLISVKLLQVRKQYPNLVTLLVSHPNVST